MIFILQQRDLIMRCGEFILKGRLKKKISLENNFKNSA